MTDTHDDDGAAPDGAAEARPGRRERRRRARERRFDSTVPSPCIAVCQLDSATDLCLGCRRHVDEIRDWPIMSAEEKRAAWARIDERATANLPAGANPNAPAGSS